MKLKKDDTVQVMTGNNAGKKGRVLSVNKAGNKVVVEGVNVCRKSVRRSQRNPQGGILSKEKAISASNVMVVCNACGKPSRIGIRVLESGDKNRICKKCKAVISVITTAKKVNA